MNLSGGPVHLKNTASAFRQHEVAILILLVVVVSGTVLLFASVPRVNACDPTLWIYQYRSMGFRFADSEPYVDF